MKIAQTDRSRLLPLISSTAAAVAQLLVAGVIAGLAFVLMDTLAWQAAVSAAIVALAVVVAIAWQQSRADARKQFLAALDAYAERQSSRALAPQTDRDWLVPTDATVSLE
jgi:hypothetical protein